MDSHRRVNRPQRGVNQRDAPRTLDKEPASEAECGFRRLARRPRSAYHTESVAPERADRIEQVEREINEMSSIDDSY